LAGDGFKSGMVDLAIDRKFLALLKLGTTYRWWDFGKAW
jgi:hypothetical protein